MEVIPTFSTGKTEIMFRFLESMFKQESFIRRISVKLYDIPQF